MGTMTIGWRRFLPVAGLAVAVAGCAGSGESGAAGANGSGGGGGTAVGGAAGSAGTGGGAGTGGAGTAGGGIAGSGVGGGAGTGGGAGAGGRAGTSGGAGTGSAGAAGRAGAGGGAGSGGSGAAGVTGVAGAGPAPTNVPTPKQACPPIKSGAMTFLGQAVTVWAGTPTATSHGPLVFYWHGTGSNPQEALYGLGQAVITQITSQGGMVAAPAQTNGQGTNTGNGVWFTGDFDVSDEIVGCAVEQLHIDTRRIHASGMSAGGLQTTWMAYARSAYVSSVVPYSGGLTRSLTLQDPGNVPAAMAVHGAMGADVYGTGATMVDFSTLSARYLSDVKAKGGFALDCNHKGGHTIPSGIGASTWRFLQDHPYKVKPEPYAAALPAGFADYCAIP